MEIEVLHTEELEIYELCLDTTVKVHSSRRVEISGQNLPNSIGVFLLKAISSQLQVRLLSEIYKMVLAL